MPVQIVRSLSTAFKRQRGGEALAYPSWDPWCRGDRADTLLVSKQQHPTSPAASILFQFLRWCHLLCPCSSSGKGPCLQMSMTSWQQSTWKFHAGRRKSSPRKSSYQHLDVFLCQRCFINSLLLQPQHLIPVCPLTTLDPTAVNTSVSAHPARTIPDICSYKRRC